MEFDLGAVEILKRARLPHWAAQHAIYFVTFGLADAIPSNVRMQIRADGEAQLSHIRTMRGNVTPAERQAIDQWVRAKTGGCLDKGFGNCFMRDERIAQIVADTITHFDHERYDLLCWCVMPNHVHVVFNHCTDVPRTVHSWKSYTAHAANKLLGRSGTFWQNDYFDRCIRDSRELENTIAYVLNNPAKAGLLNWPFTQAYPDRIGAIG